MMDSYIKDEGIPIVNETNENYMLYQLNYAAKKIYICDTCACILKVPYHLRGILGSRR